MNFEDTDLTKLPLLKLYEYQRSCPRVDLRLPVMVTTEDNEMIRASTRNISPDGLLLRCGAAVAGRLRPGGKQIKANDGPTVILRFSLPAGDTEHDFVAPGQLTYIAFACMKAKY